MKQEKWALFSVFDKTGVASDAQRLVNMGWKIISSGGTAKVLMDAGIPVKDVSELVGGKAILGNRVVTLSREVHAALLADALKSQDLEELEKLGIPFIDFCRVDFYPMKKIIAEANELTDRKAAIAKVIEGTDIGGPCMVRSAAKGLRIVVCRKQDMIPVLLELEDTGDICEIKRQELRARAEYEVAMYAAISAEFHSLGKFKIIGGARVASFKGENGPQGPAGLFISDTDNPLSLYNFELIEGSALSYCNWCDVDRLLHTMPRIAAAWKLNFGYVPRIAIGVKHGNPCGAAVHSSEMEAARNMILGDPSAIFGGFIITNFPITEHIANAMASNMPDGHARFDGVIAPAFDKKAIPVLSRKRGKCRLILNPALAGDYTTIDNFRQVHGGFLSQPANIFFLDFKHPEISLFGTDKLSMDKKKDLLLAWAIGSTSNSNTITLVKNRMLIGNGVGQQDRVGAAKLAIRRAIDSGKFIEGAAAYSDSFFPFPDAVEVLIKAGVKTIFSTSGSIKDKEIQELCMEEGIALCQMPDSLARGFFRH